MNTKQLVEATVIAHQADKTDFQHVQTTITSIIGILRGVLKHIDDPKLLESAIPIGIEELKVELEKVRQVELENNKPNTVP